MTQKHSQNVLNSLEEIEKRRVKLLGLSKQMVEANGGDLYPVDLFGLGAIKRTISTASGFRLLIESFNLICARVLLRMQIDTALRFCAIFLTESPQKFASDVLGGRQINKLKDSLGNKMTDAYLVSRLAPEHPWLPDVYKNLSGYVHFSDQHLFSPIQRVDSESRIVEYRIGETDIKFPEFSWIEAIDCFNDAIDIFTKYLEKWIIQKTKF